MNENSACLALVEQLEASWSTWGAALQDRFLEVARSIAESRVAKSEPLTSPERTKHFLTVRYAGLAREEFSAIFLNTQHSVIAFQTLFIGTIDSCAVYPRDVVQAALACRASAAIFAHNHPSGQPEPSTADIRITERLRDALGLIDIRVLDHLVVGSSSVVSFAERGLL